MIPLVKPYLGKNVDKYVKKCLKGWVSSQGPYVREFEERFADYIGTKYALTTSSGTTALHLCLLGLGVKGNVSVPNMTFPATINSVLHVGAKPKIIGTDVNSWCMDWRYVKTKVVVPVHLYGRPCEIKPGYTVIEDCAEALGANIGDRRVGSLGDCGAFSFFANKIITTGEGGMVTTNDESLYYRMKALRDHGRNESKVHVIVGYNYRMTNLQAALGLAQLEEITEILSRRDEISTWYSDFLGVTKPPGVCWLYTTEVNGRDQVIERLKGFGIESRPMFEPLSTLRPYKKYVSLVYHNSENLSKRGISLPTYYGIKKSEVRKICEVVLG